MESDLSKEEKATNDETWRHIWNVQRLLLKAVSELNRRLVTHDQSKLVPPEVSTFVEFTPKLKGSTYGSDEYKGFLAAMKPALDHHYSCNRHHPEHYENGILDMNLIDLLEMVLDWKAATMRHEDGDIRKSVELNSDRFNYSDELKQIFHNTVDWLESADEIGGGIQQ